jgi:hypothetical protein
MKRMTLTAALVLSNFCILSSLQASEGCSDKPKPCSDCGPKVDSHCAPQQNCCNPCANPGVPQNCYDCTFEEGTDIDSLTPAAQSKELLAASQARIIFEGPEDVGVWLNGRRMSALGKKRSYLVPLPDANASYEYEIRVDAVLNSKKYFRRIKIEALKAGTILSCKVESAEGEEVRLDAQVVPVIQP